MDLDGVPLQGPAVAKQCPKRADLDHASQEAVAAVPMSLAARTRRTAAQAYEDEVLAAVAAGPAVAVIPAGEPAAARRATLLALGSPARIVVGAWLPDDPVGRRTGRSAVLVRDPAGGWLPVVVKSHQLTRPHKPGRTLVRSLLDQPHGLDPDRVEVVDAVRFRGRALGDDALELAHHWRLLEAAELAAARGPVGGVVDRTGSLWWVDLEEARWTPHWADGRPVSSLARYDRAFALRLEAIAARVAHDRDPSVPLRVEPVWIGECATCPWQDGCRLALEAVDHVSLLPGSTYRRFAEHRERGTTTRSGVAALHWPTARLVAGPDRRARPVDVRPLLAAASSQPPSRPLTELVAGGPAGTLLRDRLAEAGLATVADLDRIDLRTAAYADADVGHLPSVIDEARAAVAGRPFRHRGVDRITVTRADVEVDVDMENVEGGSYLWGTYVTVRSPLGAAVGEPEGYHPFLSWEPMTGAVAAEVFGRFWVWIQDLRARCEAAGASFAAYCYTAAEEHQMRHTLAAAPPGWDGPDQAALDELARSPQWVDLYAVVRSSVEVGHGRGLKKMAPLAGFAWRDDDPGGDQSMVWHEFATAHPDPAERAAFRARLLAYNEDDVLATLALREWLDADGLPPIESWDPARPEGADRSPPVP